MAGNVPLIRFVKCPNCAKLLPEISDIPVYKCGGCGTVLRAKNRVANVDGGISSGSLGNNSQNQLDVGSLNSEKATSVEQQIPGSLDDEEKGAVCGSGCNPSRPTDQLARGRSDNAGSKPEEGIRPLDEQTEKTMNPSPKDRDCPRLSDQLERSSESFGINATSSEDDLKLAAESSHSYYGSSSSPDVIRENRVPNKYLLLSRRTFKHKKVLDSVDSMEKEAKVQTPKLPAIRINSDTNRDDLPRRPPVHALERDATFGSEDFHSVQNWMVSETDEVVSKSPSEDHLLHQNGKREAQVECHEPDHMKILKKVDELRDELSGFLARTLVEKRESHPKDQLSYIPSYLNQAQKVENGVAKLNAKQKKASVKSYCRPVSNGAPFVICHKCYKLLQLPADFLVTRKRLHKLKCGACSKVLVFSFRPRARNAPTTPGDAHHPPSEIDNYNPNSYSDDYGISFARSYSYGAEPEGVLNVSRNSSYSTEARSPRLHRLMGYPSASELLFRPRGTVSEGYQSTEPSTPHFYRPPNPVEIEAEEEPNERLRTRRRGLALQGLLKKGVRELSHGIENVKMKIHSHR